MARRTEMIAALNLVDGRDVRVTVESLDGRVIFHAELKNFNVIEAAGKHRATLVLEGDSMPLGEAIDNVRFVYLARLPANVDLRVPVSIAERLLAAGKVVHWMTRDGTLAIVGTPGKKWKNIVSDDEEWSLPDLVGGLQNHKSIEDQRRPRVATP